LSKIWRRGFSEGAGCIGDRGKMHEVERDKKAEENKEDPAAGRIKIKVHLTWDQSDPRNPANRIPSETLICLPDL